MIYFLTFYTFRVHLPRLSESFRALPTLKHTLCTGPEETAASAPVGMFRVAWTKEISKVQKVLWARHASSYPLRPHNVCVPLLPIHHATATQCLVYVNKAIALSTRSINWEWHSSARTRSVPIYSSAPSGWPALKAENVSPTESYKRLPFSDSSVNIVYLDLRRVNVSLLVYANTNISTILFKKQKWNYMKWRYSKPSIHSNSSNSFRKTKLCGRAETERKRELDLNRWRFSDAGKYGN